MKYFPAFQGKISFQQEPRISKKSILLKIKITPRTVSACSRPVTKQGRWAMSMSTLPKQGRGFGQCAHFNHRHLSNIDCLMARTVCLVCFISTVNGRSKKKKEEEA